MAGAELPAIAPDSPCYLQFSSGSTRTPTGVLVLHKALMANCVAITRDGLQVVPSDRAISWLPLYHDMGLIGFLLAPLSCQMSVDPLPTGAFVRRPLLWIDLISRNKATTAYSPTFGYELVRPPRSGASRWITTISATGASAGLGGDMIRPMPPLKAFVEAFGPAGFSDKAFVASYGMAEATLALSMAPLGKGLRAETLDVERLERDALAVDAPEGSERARTSPVAAPPCPTTSWKSGARTAKSRPSAASAASSPRVPR
ncbi:AMP-binding protein [Caulobacter segnis]